MQIRASFKKWLYQARWASEVERVKEECTKLIPDIHGFLNGAINPRLQLLEEGAAAEARRTDLLADKNKEIWAHLQSTIVGQLLHVKTARLSCLAVVCESCQLFCSIKTGFSPTHGETVQQTHNRFS